MTNPTPDRNPADELLAERRGSVHWLTFNRPQARNALTWRMYDRLVEECDAVNRDRSVRAMVLTGAGGQAFVAGTDIAQFRDFASERDALDYEARGSEVMRAIESVRVPTIAAIAGACTGAGGAIAAACDLRIAAASARYGFPIARTLGNCLSMSNYARVSALVGVARLKDLIFRARLMDAQEMLAAGMLIEVTPDESSLLIRAQEVALEVGSHAPLTLWATKEALRRLRDHTIPPDADRDLIVRCYLSRDFKEGVEAFLAKRKPVWTGE
ncbi:MAG TPA: enoyl-CoA hydratase/isomerase family protein [Candidatus Limnocylindrales bacterium]|nr:enoyl-CoA hydratase/isomerase family protein [Candidatus Limnocylindrales bacterium]